MSYDPIINSIGFASVFFFFELVNIGAFAANLIAPSFYTSGRGAFAPPALKFPLKLPMLAVFDLLASGFET